mgnify:FL=1
MANLLSSDPVVVDAWHPVAHGAELDAGAIKAAKLLGEDVVVWQGTGGVHVWQDLCIHRGVKLSLGRVESGCELRCPYHGWTYDESGRCVRMPAHPSMNPPPRARVKTFASREAGGLLWASLSENPPPLPVIDEFSDPAFRAIPCGPYSAEAGAPRLLENFLDVAHLPIVHEGALGVASQAEIAPYDVEWIDGRPFARDIRIFQPNPEGTGQAGEVTYEYGVLSPFSAYLRKRMADGKVFALLFAVAPVAEAESTGYFTIFVNYGDPADDAGMAAFQDQIFAQDVPIVTSQRPERLPLDLAEELHLPSDRLAIAYRQYVRRLGLTFGTA